MRTLVPTGGPFDDVTCAPGRRNEKKRKAARGVFHDQRRRASCAADAPDDRDLRAARARGGAVGAVELEEPPRERAAKVLADAERKFARTSSMFGCDRSDASQGNRASSVRFGCEARTDVRSDASLEKRAPSNGPPPPASDVSSDRSPTPPRPFLGCWVSRCGALDHVSLRVAGALRRRVLVRVSRACARRVTTSPRRTRRRPGSPEARTRPTSRRAAPPRAR